MNATHPATEELAAFSLGKLEAAASESVAEHLESCPECRQTVAETPSDTFLDILRSARPKAATSVPASPSLEGATRSLLAGQTAAAQAAPTVPPELADHARFRILAELGRGGMGVVYQAEHRLMERLVAIKVISKALLDHPQALERFHREVRAAAKLDHPNIVRAYDAEQAGGLHMLVMEFVDGLDLAKVLERKGQLPVAHSCHYVRQAALGLQHAYEKGMVHRDLKPQNLMLIPNKGTVKILDFGLARLASERQQGKGLTAQNAVMGTPEYMAPEQATDASTADIRADIYSLGCTLYCLVAGRPPFQEDTPVKMILAHLEKEPTPLHEVRPEVPRELSAVVAKMLAKEPGQRYQTPKEVAEALAAFCKPGAKVVPATPAVSRPAVQMSTGTVCATDTAPVPTAPAAAASQAPPEKAEEARALPVDPPASPWEELTTNAHAPQPEEKTEKRGATVGSKAGTPRWWLLGGAAAAAIVLAAGLVIWLKTRDGILMLEIDPPDAQVTVAGETITVKHDGESVKVERKPGTYEIVVSKPGFKAHSEKITVEAGKSLRVSVTLVKPAPPPIKVPHAGDSIDLLRLVNPDTHAIQGKWRIIEPVAMLDTPGNPGGNRGHKKSSPKAHLRGC